MTYVPKEIISTYNVLQIYPFASEDYKLINILISWVKFAK